MSLVYIVKKKSFLFAVCCVVIAIVIFGFSNLTQANLYPVHKSRILFKEHMDIQTTKNFINKHDLKPFSVTFGGNDYSCGGVINKADEIDIVAKEIISSLEKDANNFQLDEELRNKIKKQVEAIKRDGLKVREIEVWGAVPVEVKNSKLVDKVIEKHKK